MAKFSDAEFSYIDMERAIYEWKRSLEIAIQPFTFNILNGLIALIANALIILIFVFNKRLRSTNNVLMLNIAVTNLIYVFYCIPVETLRDHNPSYYKWDAGELLCKIDHYVLVVVTLVTVYTFIMMTLDRFYAILFPTSGTMIRDRFIKRYSLFIIWIPILICALPVLMLFGYDSFGDSYRGDIHCMFKQGNNEMLLFNRIIFTSSYELPMGICFAMNLIILCWVGCMKSEKQSAEKRSEEQYLTLVVFIMVFIYSILWLPIYVIMDERAVKDPDILYATHFMAYSTFSVIPLTYICLAKDFRNTLWKGKIYEPVSINEQVNDDGRFQMNLNNYA